MEPTQSSIPTRRGFYSRYGVWLCAGFFAVLAPLWFFFIAPWLTRLPADFSYTADIASLDNLYDEDLQQFGGEVQSNTLFSYKAQAGKDGVLDVLNVFDVRKPSGEKIFSVERHYGVNAITGAHVAGSGDKSRAGYLFAPKHLKKGEPFTYWHINYDDPAPMRFVAEENLLGLPVYRYETRYEGVRVDQTKNLGFLPGVGTTRGVRLEPYLQLWIEPSTGRLVKYEDRTTAYFYDLETGKRLSPWNVFSNRYTFASVADQVRDALKEKQKAFFIETLVPLMFGAAALLCLGVEVFRRRRVDALRNAAFVSTLIVLVSLSGTYTSWSFVRETVENTARLQFEAQVNDVHNTITNKLQVYVNAILAARGLYAASSAVERDEWRDFVRGINLEQNYPGITALSFNARVVRENLATFQYAARKNGLPAYTVFPEGLREEYVPITFIEPESANVSVLGYDVFSEAVRRAALEKARDTGMVVMTGKVALQQDQSERPGFLFFAPVYENGALVSTEEERRVALKGYIGGAISVDNFMRGVLGTHASSVSVEVFDTDDLQAIADTTQLYRSNASYTVRDSSLVPRFRRNEVITFGERTWTVVYASLPGFGANFAQTYLPPLVAVGGVFFCALLWATIYSLVGAREKARELARAMTKDVEKSKVELLKRSEEAERLNKLMIDREIKMVALKKEMESLKK